VWRPKHVSADRPSARPALRSAAARKSHARLIEQRNSNKPSRLAAFGGSLGNTIVLFKVGLNFFSRVHPPARPSSLIDEVGIQIFLCSRAGRGKNRPFHGAISDIVAGRLAEPPKIQADLKRTIVLPRGTAKRGKA